MVPLLSLYVVPFSLSFPLTHPLIPSSLHPRSPPNTHKHEHVVAIFFWILIALTTRAQALGRPYAWAEPIFELPWFGQWPGYPEPGAFNGGYPGYAYPAGMPPMMGAPYGPGAGAYGAGGYVVQQNPGHSIVIQPNPNGQPTITQVPGMVSAA